MKWYQAIFTLLIGVGIGIFLYSYWPEPDHIDIEDPQIHRLKEEIGWRDFRESQTKERIKKDSIEKIALAKDVIKERSRANQSESKLREHRKEAHPLTTKDTISFLIEDDTLCDRALADSKKLVNGLTKEVVNDNKEIAHLDSLNSDLEADKKDLQKIDTLHQEKEKTLEKKVKKNFWKGFSWGAIFLGAAELAWKLLLLL